MSLAFLIRPYIYIIYFILFCFELPAAIPHVALARCNSFDKGVCDCFAGVVRTQVTKVKVFMARIFKMYQK